MTASIYIPEEMKNVYVETYGCQMNEYDSGIALNLLKREGYRSVATPEEAGVILLNTCAVRENAHQRIYRRLQALSFLKRKNPDLVIGILGCMAQNLGDDLLAMGLPLDLTAGPDNYRDLANMILKLKNKEETRIDNTRLSAYETYEDIDSDRSNRTKAFLTIMRGCNNFCTFCVVPYTRGRERSSDPESLLRRIRTLIESGIREITLLGQNVNSYRHDPSHTDFTDLLNRMLHETDIERIRFTSPHPRDFPERLLELMAAEPRFCSHIHLPVQSGSDEVLASMRRDYTRSEFINLVHKIREIVGPDVGLSTDVIVGFPGESEQQFGHTLELIQEVGFDMAFMFRYSRRENTYADKKMIDDVPDEVKGRRLQNLIDLQIGISRERNRASIGSEYEVMPECKSRRSADEYMGRTPQNKTVIFAPETELLQDPDRILQGMYTIRISDSSSATLRGEVIESSLSL